MRRAVTVERVGQSLVFRITVLHRQADKAAAIANAVARLYLERVDANRNQNTAGAIRTLEAQTEIQRRKLEAADRAVQDYRATHDLVSNGTNGLVVDQQIGDLYTRIGAARVAIARLDAQLSGNPPAPGAEAADATEAAVGSALAALRAQRVTLALEAARLDQTLGPNHPSVVTAKTQLHKVEELIAREEARTKENTRAERDRAAAMLASLTKQARALAEAQKSSNAAQVDLRELERDAGAIRVVYEDSLRRLNELRQQLDLPTNNSQIVSAAETPTRTGAPPLPLVAGAVLLFGFVLGVAIAFARETFFPRAAKPASVDDAVRPPLDAVAASEPPSPIAEIAPPPPVARIAGGVAVAEIAAPPPREIGPPPATPDLAVAVAAPDLPPASPSETVAAAPAAVAPVAGRDEPETEGEAEARDPIPLLGEVPGGTAPRSRSARVKALRSIGLRLLAALGSASRASVLLVPVDGDRAVIEFGRALGETLADFGGDAVFYRPVAQPGRRIRYEAEAFSRTVGAEVAAAGATAGSGEARRWEVSLIGLTASLTAEETAELHRRGDAVVLVARDAEVPAAHLADLRERLGDVLAEVVGFVVVEGGGDAAPA